MNKVKTIEMGRKIPRWILRGLYSSKVFKLREGKKNENWIFPFG